ncbi:MAG: hypothetical protein KatS3mg104_2981 [Phycisphaerae bacterium]|nr:MAG: hypothetical protein KatS3mg104_2981 [Phycisphaerae bacterium]
MIRYRINERNVLTQLRRIWRGGIRNGIGNFVPYSTAQGYYPVPWVADPYKKGVKKLKYDAGYWEYKMKRQSARPRGSRAKGGVPDLYNRGVLWDSMMIKEVSHSPERAEFAVFIEDKPYRHAPSITTGFIVGIQASMGRNIFDALDEEKVAQMIANNILDDLEIDLKVR